MRLNKKHRPYLAGIALFVAYLLTRLYGILSVPIFTDEAIYIRWTQIFRADIHQFFISLTDGKQPLFIWLGAAFLGLFDNPLLDVRLVSVTAGLITCLGLYFLARELFHDKKVALLAAAFYIIFPFSLVYDRLALYDSLLATFAVWSLYMQVILIRKQNFPMAILAAMVTGGGLLTKSSAFFFIYLLPASLLLFDFHKTQIRSRLTKWLLLSAVLTVGALACYSVLRFSPYYDFIGSKNTTFIHPFHEWIRNPFAFIGHNIVQMSSDLLRYATAPLLIAVMVAFFVEHKYRKQKLLLLVWFVVPFMALAFFGNRFYLFPRYMLFMTMPLVVLGAFGVIGIASRFKSRYVTIATIAIVGSVMIYKDVIILCNFPKAPIPHSDRQQLISGYASGVGVNETVDYLRKQANDKKIYVATQGIFGLMPDSLQAYLGDNSNIQIKGFWPIINNAPPQEALDMAKEMPTYFIFYAPYPKENYLPTGVAPQGWPLRKVFQIKRLDGTRYTLYQVISD